MSEINEESGESIFSAGALSHPSDLEAWIAELKQAIALAKTDNVRSALKTQLELAERQKGFYLQRQPPRFGM